MDMTTTLTEKVSDKIEEYGDDYAAWKDGGLEDIGLEDTRDIAADIIALVRADMARQMLSDEAVEAACSDRDVEVIADRKIDISAINIDMSGAIQAALAAIGITVEDDQP